MCACAVGEKAPDINFKSVADQRLENCGYMSEKSTAENFLCLHSLLGQYHAGMHSHFSMSETLFGISDYKAKKINIAALFPTHQNMPMMFRRQKRRK